MYDFRQDTESMDTQSSNATQSSNSVAPKVNEPTQKEIGHVLIATILDT